MGDCYSVELRVKLRKTTKANMQKLLRLWMYEKEKEKDTDLGNGQTILGVNWSLSTYRKAGIRPDSFNGICKILLAFHQGDAKHIVDEEGFDLYRSGFNASYGWYSVMREAFEEMSWALADGSYLEVSRDEGCERLEIEVNKKGDAELWEHHDPPYGEDRGETDE